MTSSHISSGVTLARGTSALRRLGQYTQSKAQSLLISILSSEMHRPSGVNEWHIPPNDAFPSPSALFFRRDPDEEQDTSYFAPSVRIFSRSSSIMPASRRPFCGSSASYYTTFFRKSQTFVRCFLRKGEKNSHKKCKYI